MKAILARRQLSLLSTLALALLSACAERAVVPTPRPSATPPPPAPAPPPSVSDWRRAPQTPGDWTYSTENGQGVARFSGLLALRCDRAGGSVVLERSGASAGPVPVTIRTSSVSVNRTATPLASNPSVLAVRFPANDPALDAMAFSRGRFAVDVPGLAELYLPSWSEVGRVVENCR